MPLLQIPALEAVNRIKNEGLRVKWPDYRFPTERFEGVVEISCSTTFEIGQEDKIFTMGSCFARNIERRLNEIGFDTVMYNAGILEELATLGEGWSFTNKYNVSTIRQELEWAFGIDRPAEEFVLLPTPNGGVLDPFLNQDARRGAPLEDARRRRAFVESLVRRADECRVVVMTMGLAEVWRDLRSGLRLNVAPLSAIAADPDRFVLEVMSYDEILSELEGIYAVLTAKGHPDLRILITVSPVPLQATFRPEDVMTANSYSKAVQRAAVEAFVLGHDNVDYFPSYETVTLTDRRLAFAPDNRHVQPAVVARIVDRFVAAYAPDLKFDQTERPLMQSVPVPTKPRDLFGAARLHVREGKYSRAAKYYSKLIEKFGDRHDFVSTSALRLHYGGCLLRSGRLEDGLSQTELASQADDATTDIIAKCADRFITNNRPDMAARVLARTIAKDGPSPELSLRLEQLALVGDDVGGASAPAE